jgi:hypothetical protein
MRFFGEDLHKLSDKLSPGAINMLENLGFNESWVFPSNNQQNFRLIIEEIKILKECDQTKVQILGP